MLALISVCIRLGPLALQQTDSVSLVWSAIAEPRVDLFVLCSSLPLLARWGHPSRCLAPENP